MSECSSAHLLTRSEDGVLMIARLQAALDQIIDWTNLVLKVSTHATQSTLGTGRQTVDANGTAQRLVDESLPVKWVTVQALSDNTSDIEVGDSAVVAAEATQRGVRLPLYAAQTFNGVDLYDVWIDSVTNDDGVSFTYGT